MNVRNLPRVFSLLIISIGVGWYLGHDLQWKHLMGREAYLAHQAAYFDKNLSGPQHLLIDTLVCALMVGFLFVVYELIALLLAGLIALLRKRQAT